MLLRGGAFSACNAAVAAYGNANCRFSGVIRPPAAVRARRAGGSLRVAAVATGEQKSKPQEPSCQPSLADRLRLGSLNEDGLSYKEKFIVRCYEVGINKTATVETIANLLQVLKISEFFALIFPLKEWIRSVMLADSVFRLDFW